MPAVSVLSSASTVIAAANYRRLGIVITNDDATANCHLAFGEAATTDEAYLAPKGNVSISDYRMKHSINGISSSGTITIKYSEIKQ